MLPIVQYLETLTSYPRLVRPYSTSHYSTSRDVVSTYQFWIPFEAVEKQAMLCVVTDSEVLRVPRESNVLLEDGWLALDVRDGKTKWTKEADVVG